MFDIIVISIAGLLIVGGFGFWAWMIWEGRNSDPLCMLIRDIQAITDNLDRRAGDKSE